MPWLLTIADLETVPEVTVSVGTDLTSGNINITVLGDVTTLGGKTVSQVYIAGQSNSPSSISLPDGTNINECTTEDETCWTYLTEKEFLHLQNVNIDLSLCGSAPCNIKWKV